MAGGVAPRGPDDGLQPLAEINITPLVDVMLVLLIVFMVAAPMMTVGVPVELPSVKAQAITPPAPPIQAAVDAEGRFFLDREPIPREVLETRLAALAAEDKNRSVHVRGDRHAAYGGVAELMSAIGAAGFSKVALLTDPKTP